MNVIGKSLGFLFFSILLFVIINMQVFADQDTAAAEADTTTAAEASADVASVEQPAESAVPPLARGAVARAAFTNAVEEREPVDQISSQSSDVQSLTFFTELSGLQGQTALHRWEYAGEVVAEVPFSVGGARWRVWSNKSVSPELLGKWTVSVVNGNGDVIASESLEYQEVAEQQQSTAPAASSEALTTTAQ